MSHKSVQRIFVNVDFLENISWSGQTNHVTDQSLFTERKVKILSYRNRTV